MSAPRTKRQFAGAASDPAQRQITSFFASNPAFAPSSSSPSPSPFADTHSSSSAGGASRSGTGAAQNANGPSLPPSVQTNLLSVGMRVRKSVPEGYKTGSSYGAFALWDESAAARPTTPQRPPLSTTATTTSSSPAESRSRANAFSSPRELLPFCGIHKVGGLGTQPGTETETGMGSLSAHYRAPILGGQLAATAAIDDEDDMPGLTSSQDTVASTDSDGSPSATRARKRSFVEDEDELSSRPAALGVGGVWRDGHFDGQVSPRSLVPVGWGRNTGNAGGRVMAVPRKGRQRNKKAAETASIPIPIPIPASASAAVTAMAGKAALGQENVMVLDGDDFDEADFLDSGRSWEVEMSGV